jgi:NADH:ubiquinone oxidoreductase subunit B-like Fe-S oxidoreductase
MEGEMAEWWNGLSSRQRSLVVVAGVADAGLKVVAFTDLKRRPADQIRGPKWLWAAIVLINSGGLTSLSYLVLGRRRS